MHDEAAILACRVLGNALASQDPDDLQGGQAAAQDQHRNRAR
jgi:hypothetical protein